MINLTFDPRLLVLKVDPDVSDENLYSRPETEFRDFSQDTVFFPVSPHFLIIIKPDIVDCYYLLQIYCPNCSLQQF